jgi:hypothetical protein
MIILPIGSYFATVHTIFKGIFDLIPLTHSRSLTRPTLGNSTYAGALAAVMANVVLIGWVIVAMNEDQTDAIEAAKKLKGKKAE